MAQARKTQDAQNQYDTSVEQNAPPDVQKNLYDNMVWEEIKSHALRLETNEMANTKIAEQNKKETQDAQN
jgi:hypothetical protein